MGTDVRLGRMGGFNTLMLDFDTLLNLHRTDPAIFEILRKKILDREIRKQSQNNQDLWNNRGWWVRLELELRKHKTPAGRMVAASNLMRIKLNELNRAYKELL